MSLMTSAITLFVLCFVLNGIIVRYKIFHEFQHNSKTGKPQNIHSGYIPRIGGLTIYFGLIISYFIQSPTILEALNWSSKCILVLPLFLAGLGEDITHQVSIKVRFLAALLSGILVFYFYDCSVNRIDIYWVDHYILIIPLVSLSVTTLAIAGLANGYNLIDGLNGLASMVGIISLTAILYVAFKVGDTDILRSSLMMIAMLLAFFFFNYPRGLLFLGDGGAYLVGFIIAVNSIKLVLHHSEVSAWFALLVNAYPITETIFTIWRRFFIRNRNPLMPDALHFHSLLYRKILRWTLPLNEEFWSGYTANAQASPFLWVLSSLCVFPAILFWNNTCLSQISTIIFILIYLWLYSNLASPKNPKI